MSAPTEGEEKILIDFRSRVKDVLETEAQQKDSFLIRWLRARNHDLKQAENMLRTSLAWRKEHRIDFILELPIDTYCEKEFPFYIHGIDKLGQPVIVAPIGKWNFRKCVADDKTEEFKYYVNYRFEEISRAMDNRNIDRDPDLYPVTQFTIIMDWKGYSYMQLCSLKAVQNLLYTAITYEAHYPEVLSAALLINCPSFFHIVMMMVKQILAAKTFEKLKVYGSDRKEWEQACREIIDDDQLTGMLKLVD